MIPRRTAGHWIRPSRSMRPWPPGHPSRLRATSHCSRRY